MKNIDLTKIPRDIMNVIELIDEFALYEEVLFRQLYEHEKIRLVNSKNLMKYLPEILFFKHGFGLIKIGDEIFIIENPNVFIKEIKDLYEMNIPLLMTKLCLDKLYDSYRFFSIIDSYKKRLYMYFDREYARKTINELKSILKKTLITKEVLCR
jgi:hypothetical protein